MNQISPAARELAEKIVGKFYANMITIDGAAKFIQSAFDEQLKAKDARIAELEALGKRLYDALKKDCHVYGGVSGEPSYTSETHQAFIAYETTMKGKK